MARSSARQARIEGYFEGDIDDLRLYGRPLEEREIESLVTSSDIQPPIVTPNTLPVVSDIPDVTFLENHYALGINFNIEDAETPPDFLTVTANSSNPGLIPTENIFMTGNGANWRMALLPELNQSGRATITINVSDSIGVTSRNFLVRVRPFLNP